MAEPDRVFPQEEPWPTEADIDAVIAEYEGDIRALTRALLTDLATLAADRERQVSHGYLRRPRQGRAA